MENNIDQTGLTAQNLASQDGLSGDESTINSSFCESTTHIRAEANSDDAETPAKPPKTMKYIDDDVRRRHTFDKRRQRLFQEARDLSILCGTEYALVVASDSQIFTEASPNLAGLLSDEGRNAILDCLHGKVGESDAADGARAINQSPSPPAPDIENRAAV